MLASMSAILAAIAMLQGAPAPAAPAPACETAEHRALDFWVGDWDVYPNGKDQPVARSLIEKLYDGCAIRENWMPLKGQHGGSLSNLDAETGRWHQTWLDGGGKRIEFVGGRVGEMMVLTGYWDDVGGPGKDALVRMTYSPREDGSVRQHGEASVDHGLNWKSSFDFVYKPRGAS